MIKYISRFIIVLFTGILVCNCSIDPKDQLIHEIKTIFDNEPGEFALAFKDLSTGDSLLINADDLFHAASTMKTPVMIEVYKQAASGGLQLDDSISIKNEFSSIVDASPYSLNRADDSEFELYDRVGQKKLLSELVYDMIIVSSNLATNLIIEWVDPKKVTQSMRALGAPSIEVLRGVEDIKAFEAGLSNRTTAYDLMKIFEMLAKGEVVSAAASAEMLNILKDQRFNEIIPALLPDRVEVAHKTGSITGVHHDSGVVFLPNGQSYVIVILSRELEDFEHATTQMAEVSKLIYDYVKGDY